MKRLLLSAVPCLLLLGGCQTAEDDTVDGSYDQALLEEYLRAIPPASLLEAPAPEAATAAKGIAEVGEPAMFPQQAVPVAKNINQTIKNMLDTLDAVVQSPPTVYNSETKEFFWGPIENNGSEIEGDTVALYIRDQGEDADFRYSYAWLRGVGADTSTLAPVIWGGSNPDPDNEDYGDGVALWDYEANYEWMLEHYPDEADSVSRGRFVARYAKGPSSDQPDKIVTVVVAVFRDFVGEDAAADAIPADLDYFWGNVFDGTNELDFLDFAYQDDLKGTSTDTLEDFDMQLAFYNNGIGRAEATVTDGDLPEDIPGYYVAADECWDAALLRTFYEVVALPEDPESDMPEHVRQLEGDPANCAIDSLDSIPSLDDLDPAFLDALDNLASNGVPQSE